MNEVKILALGGCGDMGRMAVAVLLESPSISKITVADINYNLATTFVEMVGSDKLKAVQIDINEKDMLLDLMSSHDIVINCVGPFYKFEIPIIEAVIKAKKPFLDICDDWKPTLDALELSEQAKNAGITAIIGIGASPGISNLMAVLVSSKLDEIDELITAWGASFNIKEGKKPQYYIKERKIKKKLGKQPKKANAAIEHLIYETIEDIPTFKDGKIKYIESLTEHEPLAFPGFNEVYACHIGHPEPVTLSRIINAKIICNLCYMGKTLTDIIREYREQIINKEIKIQQAAIDLENEIKKMIRRAMTGRSPIKEYIKVPPSLTTYATGVKDGKRRKVCLTLKKEPYDEMAGLTGVPLAIATIMMIEGNVTKKGIFTPEEVIDPIEFFNRFAQYCDYNSAEDLLLWKIIDI